MQALKLAGAHAALYDGDVPLKIQQRLSVLINLEWANANDSLLILDLVVTSSSSSLPPMVTWCCPGPE